MSGISKRVSGSWVSGDYGIMKTATDTITTLPAVLYPNDTTATVGLKGNMSQTGTPTPQNPIQPSECGERTANLFDKDATDTSKGYVENRYLAASGDLVSSSLYCISEYIPIDADTTYTLFIGNAPNLPAICFYDANKIYISGESYNGSETITVISPVGAKYCRVSYAKTFIDVIMLNTGSTALPYEPYGYKIPILSNSTTTPVYLGEVETTRRIYKQILTGDETTWRITGTGRLAVRIEAGGHTIPDNASCYCSHYIGTSVTLYSLLNDGECSAQLTDSGGYREIAFYDATYTSINNFKTYIRQQYANGTPVTIWYVLAEPTTGIANEPIRKIGDYADEVSGITIPTIAGANSFDVLTTLKPSEVTVNYKGWHTGADVHEKSENLWNEDYTDISSTAKYVPINVGEGNFTLSTTFQQVNGVTDIFLLSGNVTSGISSSDNGAYAGKNITKASIDGYVTIAYRNYARETAGSIPTCQTMLNSGSTALPYEPYWK